MTCVDDAYATAGRRAGKEKTVLVVEDEPTIRVVLTDLLSDAGYSVLNAADGREALERLKSSRPNLIVLDLLMPSMSGWRFLEDRRKLPGADSIPVVVVSAIDGRHDYPHAVGAAAWLCKPLDVARFLGTVEELVL